MSIAFLSCGHLARCLQCAPAFITCPVCSAKVKGTVKVHFWTNTIPYIYELCVGQNYQNGFICEISISTWVL